MIRFFLSLILALHSPLAFAGSQAITRADLVDGIYSNKNYLKDKSHAEKNVIGVNAYADAAGTSPVDGTAGSPTVTCTRTTSSPLAGDGSLLFTKDAANRQGNGCSMDFTVDTTDKAKVLKIEFDYIVGSGTFVAGVPGSSGSDSDITVWIYDVTNAVLIQPSSIRLFSNSSTISDKWSAYFQAASNSTSYRLILHAGSTSASAYTVLFDNLKVSRSEYVYGTPISDWTAYTPTVGATTTPPGEGTGVTKSTRWRRVGDAMELVHTYAHTGAGTAGSGAYKYPLPTGYTMDTSKITVATTTPTATVVGLGGSIVGSALFSITSAGDTNSINIGVVFPFDSSNLYLAGVSGAAAAQAFPFSSSNAVRFNIATLYVTWRAMVPILGWSSSLQLSDSADTRKTVALVTGDPASATSGNPIIVPTVSYDSHGAYSASTGKYTCPTEGIYKVYGSLQSASSATTLTIYKDAVSTSLAGNLDSNGESTFSSAVQCNAGSLIDLRPGGTVDATNMTINFEKVSGPSAIAATESIAARYYASATSVSGSLATVSWTTKDFDTHGGMSSGTYTVAAAGKYQVNVCVALAATYLLNKLNTVEIQKNGTAVAQLKRYIAAAVTDDDICDSDIVSASAGDTLRVQVSSDATSPSIVSSNTRNFISIMRLGL